MIAIRICPHCKRTFDAQVGIDGILCPVCHTEAAEEEEILSLSPQQTKSLEEMETRVIEKIQKSGRLIVEENPLLDDPASRWRQERKTRNGREWK